jgi:hypothetical protein
VSQVKLEGGTPDEPDKPVRLPPPDGTYLAKIVGLRHGFTREETPRPKLTLEWLLFKNEQNDETQKGRRVWQDYVTVSKGPDDWAEGHIRRLKDLLRLYDIKWTSEGFEADELLEKRAWITIRTKKKKEDQKVRSFTDIMRIAPMEPLPTANGETLHDDPDPLDEPAVEPAPPSAPPEVEVAAATAPPSPPPEAPVQSPAAEQAEPDDDDDWSI